MDFCCTKCFQRKSLTTGLGMDNLPSQTVQLQHVPWKAMIAAVDMYWVSQRKDSTCTSVVLTNPRPSVRPESVAATVDLRFIQHRISWKDSAAGVRIQLGWGQSTDHVLLRQARPDSTQESGGGLRGAFSCGRTSQSFMQCPPSTNRKSAWPWGLYEGHH